MPTLAEYLVMVETLKNLLSSRATGGFADPADYMQLRRQLILDPAIKGRLPRFISSCRNLDEFWQFIKPKFPTYHQRREYLRTEFDPLLSWIEQGAVSPLEAATTDGLTKVDLPHVQDAWRKSLDRCRTGDLEGTISAARMLIETVCKHILDEAGVEYHDDAELPKLYRAVAEQLNLAPSQHTEQVFKQILGGCTAVVEGMGSMRNRLSDAHGKSKTAPKPKARHAELAVNLAGSMASFLIETWNERWAVNLDDL